MKRESARDRRDDRPLDGDAIRNAMRRLFPKRNDYGTASFEELPSELAAIGVRTNKQFRLLMKRHRKGLLAEERQWLCAAEVRFVRAELAGRVDPFRQQSWFALPALVRTAIEKSQGGALA